MRALAIEFEREFAALEAVQVESEASVGELAETGRALLVAWNPGMSRTARK